MGIEANSHIISDVNAAWQMRDIATTQPSTLVMYLLAVKICRI